MNVDEFQKKTGLEIINVSAKTGDGVEEAFYLTNRCMTLSFHRFGDFFPGTGSLTDIGEDILVGHNVNFDINFIYDRIYLKHDKDFNKKNVNNIHRELNKSALIKKFGTTLTTSAYNSNLIVP